MYKLILLLSLVSCSASKTAETKKQISHPLITQVQKLHPEVVFSVVEDSLGYNTLSICQIKMKPLNKNIVMINVDTEKYNSLSSKQKIIFFAHELNFCYLRTSSKTVEAKQTKELLEIIIGAL